MTVHPYAMPRVVRPGPAGQLRVRPVDMAVFVLGNAALIVGMWLQHGGIALLGSTQANLVAIGQLTALLGTYAAFVQIVIYRASSWDEIIFRGEIDELARSGAVAAEPLLAGTLRQLVPDIIDRDVFVCVPPTRMGDVRKNLHTLMVPDAQLHFERFALL